MPPSSPRLRLDPWPPEYDSALQFAEVDGEQNAVVDTSVETATWAEITPGDGISFSLVYFVDGVRRIEARVIADHNNQIAHGLFGSVGVGCVRVADGKAAFGRMHVDRYLALGCGLQVSETIRVGQLDIDFLGLSSTANTPNDIVVALQNAMRTREAAIAQSITSEDGCVFADGPLSYFTTVKQQVVGVIKTIHIPYLPGEKFALLTQLQVGRRTPVFAIQDGKYDRYSWFMRVGSGRPVDHALTGIIRAEVRTAVGINKAVELANFSARYLPGCASTATRDARAPNNLVPIGALEAELRHRLGDAILMRRAIERQIMAR